MRPYKLTSAACERFLYLLSHGVTRTEAANAIKVNRRTIEIRMVADPAFADAVFNAEWDADDKVISALFTSATGGNVAAMQTWLYNRRPSEWTDKRNRTVRLEVDDATLRLIAGILNEEITDPETYSRVRSRLASIKAFGLPSGDAATETAGSDDLGGPDFQEE